ncbi:MAG: LacI family DNA-binding transcriptional regulator [Burkholderiales bacterium]|nr:LacI family DNA-binding transcriptional regulator [Opitutaceae bacterium]
MARPSSQRVNLASIAERLGVSISTVSRALRGQGGIHPETETRIVGLAHQMGYHTRATPRVEAAPGRSELRHVLVLSQSSSPHVDQRYMAGMSGAAVSANVAILSHLVAEQDCRTILDPRLGPASLRAGLVKGIVFLHRWPQDVIAQISESFPTVSIVHDFPGTSADLIGVDDRAGVAELVAHFMEAGHRRIGFFGLCPGVSWSGSRFAAYVEALFRHGLEFDAKDVVRLDEAAALSPSEFGADDWAKKIDERRRAGVDAWLCASAITGRSLCRHFIETGTEMPRDVALASCHGGSARTSVGLPPITTTDVVDEELGAAAVRRLMTRIENPRESRRSILVPCRLSVGTTTRAPALATAAS